MTAPFVLDASTAGAFILREQQHLAVVRFFASLANSDRQLIAPDFWLLECSNICRKRVARGELTRSEAVTTYRQFKKLPVIRMDTQHLLDYAIDLALAFGLTSYDALYVATAQYVGGTLVTADARLADALRASELAARVRHVSEW